MPSPTVNNTSTNIEDLKISISNKEAGITAINNNNNNHTSLKSSIMSSSGNPLNQSSPGTLIVVSNRLPFILKFNEAGKFERHASAGGLVSAVAPVVVQCKGIWVGWPGIHASDIDSANGIVIPEADPNDKTPTALLKPEQMVCVSVDKETFMSYYNDCCNGTFWPLFHSMSDKAIFSGDSWDAYVKVNNIFAEKTLEALRTANEKLEHDASVPIVWLHDYHLMVAANSIRQSADNENLRCKIGFFLHIPFPPWDIFRLFPSDDEVLQGLLACDLVAFHINDYCLNFIDCCERRLGCRVDRKSMLVEHGGRTVRVRALPIGIAYDTFVKLAEEAPKMFTATGQKLILGVDRLDYTKGLVNRLKAFERLLEVHPEHIEQVTLMQIAVPSRTDVKEYQDLKEELDQFVGNINGRFTTPNWSPIRYIYGYVSQAELAGFYRDSAVAWVSPLRDGMNLVAKEFVACQINEPGVLILSPFAGAGEMMHEALMVNPYDLDDSADVLHRALTMPLDEREIRMYHLRRREQIYNVDYWMRSFLKNMDSLIMEDGDDVTMSTTMQPVTMDDFEQYLSKYVGHTCKLALLLDYDGTLAPICPHPDLAVLPPETKRVLERLSHMSDVCIAVVSGRSVDNVKEMVGIEDITYAGNHGLEILHPDGTKFVHPMPLAYEEKVRTLLKRLQEELTHGGAWVENKGAVLTFHYREIPILERPELIRKVHAVMIENGFSVGHGHCVLEARPPVLWNKGRASIYILRTAFGVDWHERVRIIYAGDDVTDEDAIVALKGMAMTFRVTPSHTVRTQANRRLPSTDSVLMMLKWVERHMSRRKPRLLSGNTPTSKQLLSLVGEEGLLTTVAFPINGEFALSPATNHRDDGVGYETSHLHESD